MDDHFTNNTSAPKAMSMFRLFKKKKSVYFLNISEHCKLCKLQDGELVQHWNSASRGSYRTTLLTLTNA